jgi:purine-binding chemotaxis protein CheW
VSDKSFQIGNIDLTDETGNMYLDFIVGKEVYGIEVRYVLQIVGMREINEMPEMPQFMKGFITLRGSVIPVYSLHARFNKAEPVYTERTCIIVTVIDDTQVGLIVDAIQETITIEPDSISPPPGIGNNGSNPYIKGVAQIQDGKIVILLDAPKFFTKTGKISIRLS